MWLNHGKIRSGVLYDTMRHTRKLFVNALKYRRYNENNMRNNKLAESMRSKNMLQFWKTVRNQANNLQSAANITDSKDSNVEKANVFYENFSCISGKSTDSNFSVYQKKIMVQFPISITLNIFQFLKILTLLVKQHKDTYIYIIIYMPSIPIYIYIYIYRYRRHSFQSSAFNCN